ncbi:MAG TPA: ABC transporter permease, partial [Firmicutes bacterium]|nr:ABC transporter permease [Bacillota bacterium]
MTFLDLLRISSSSLLKHKLRSALTLLGIVIGILSVASVTAVIRGIDTYVARLLGSIGSQGFVISKIGIPASEEEYLKALKRKELDPEFAEIIKSSCPSVAHASPFVRTTADVKAGRRSSSDVLIEGTSADAQYMTGVGLEDGRYFTDYETRHARRVCIIGYDVAQKIFESNPLGNHIYIRGHRFTVIGVHGRMGTFFGISRDSFIRIPYTTFVKMFGRPIGTDISVQSKSPELTSTAIEEVRVLMRKLRKLRPSEPDDFGILTSEMLMRMWRRVSSNIFLVTIGVGSIALLVGGIGIMNIMFVSVKERTMEIGLRKATGATRKDIVLQFLTESSLLCLTGGGFGV